MLLLGRQSLLQEAASLTLKVKRKKKVREKERNYSSF
jgi:hypothetical protein